MKKVFVMLLAILLLSSNLFLLSGCENGLDNNNYDNDNFTIDLTSYFDETLPAGELTFTRSILNVTDFERIIPLGQINPPGHSFPTDHIYFVLNAIQKAVYAPTGGKVLYIDEPNAYGDRAIRIGVTSTMSYYLGHIFVTDGLKVGDTVATGDQIGISGNTSCVDFGVLNQNNKNDFINEKYPVTTLYGDKPLLYYSEPLRAQLYALVKPALPAEDHSYVYDGDVTDGEFMYDQAGTLLGNWFLEGCFHDDGWYDWTDNLSFAYDIFYTDQIRIGDGYYSNAFAISNADNPTKPEDVNKYSGAVAYHLYNANNTSKGLPTGTHTMIMMVQMVTESRIKLEIFEDSVSASREFTDAALYYVR